MLTRPLLIALLMCLFTAPVWAVTRFVSTTGDDTNSCSASVNIGTPKRNLTGTNGAIACMSGGDILYLRSGTYLEGIDNTFAGPGKVIPSGSSWSAPTIVARYPSDPVGSVVLRPPGASAYRVIFMRSGEQYILLDGLVLDGTNICCDIVEIGYTDGTAPHHIRLTNIEVFGSPTAEQNGMHVGHGAHHFELMNSNIHNVGGTVEVSPQEHGVYLSAPDSLVENTQIHHTSGYGLHMFDSSGPSNARNIIRTVKAYNNAAAGILIGAGSDVLVYNNLSYNNAAEGIRTGFNMTNAGVYNNTSVYNTGLGLNIASGSTGVAPKNNIIYGNGSQIVNSGASTVFDQNLCGSSGTGCEVVGNPGFVSALGGNFRLLSLGSPAVGQAVNLNTVFTTDFDGTPRGTTWDIGAYQATASPQPDPVNRLASWPLTEGTGTTAADTSGNNHPGVLDSAAWVSPGITGSSAFAPTGTQEISVANLTGLSIPTSCSLSSWVNMTVTDTNGCALISNREGCAMYVSNTGALECYIFNGTSFFVARGPSTLLDGGNHHLVCSYDAGDGSGLRGYVDLAEVAQLPLTEPISYGISGGALRISRDGATFGGYQCRGKLNAVYLYQGRLTAEGRQNLYNEQVPSAGLSVTHVGWFSANAPEGVSVGSIDTNLNQLISAPVGIRWSIHKADPGTLTEYFRPFCRVFSTLGALMLDWTEITNSFGSTGIRLYGDSVVTTGTPTSVLLPTDGFTGAPGLYVDNPVDTTSPYDAAQRLTLNQAGHAELEAKIEFGSPRVATERVECRPHRENGAPFTSYMGSLP